MIKAIIFDFDNTLEEWLPFEDEVEEHISGELAEKYGIDAKAFKDIFDRIKVTYLHSHSLPQDYGRDMWFSEALANFGVYNADLNPIINHYWELITERIRVFPGTHQTLELLKKQGYRLGMLSDSDGDRYWKDMRIKKLDVAQYFDVILTSDDIGANKPHPRCFLEVCKQLHVRPEETIMVGDNPPKDLPTAYELGMYTVWQREGVPKNQKDHVMPYMNAIIDSIEEVPRVAQEAAKVRNQAARRPSSAAQ